MHAEHLEAVHGVGPHTISVPRIKRADDIDPAFLTTVLMMQPSARLLLLSALLFRIQV